MHLLRRTSHCEAAFAANQAISRKIPSISAEKFSANRIFRACSQIGFSAYCCSAVLRSSIAKPPPFLGVSSLNLAAPRSGHFFAPVLLVAGGVARRSWALSPHRSRAPGQHPKFLAQNRDSIEVIIPPPGAGLPRRASDDSGIAVSLVSASRQPLLHRVEASRAAPCCLRPDRGCG